MRTKLGGNLSQHERERRGIYKLLDSLPGVEMGWRWQCRCGGTTYVKYRAHFYCQYCANRILYPDTDTLNQPGNTFRQAFIKNRKAA